jgi:hypothetical protein
MDGLSLTKLLILLTWCSKNPFHFRHRSIHYQKIAVEVVKLAKFSSSVAFDHAGRRFAVALHRNNKP